MKRAGYLVAEHRGPGPKILLDRPSRHRLRAVEPIPEIRPPRRFDGDRSRRHRHEGRGRHHRLRAARVEGRRPARSSQRHRRDERRRRTAGPSALDRAPDARRRRARRSLAIGFEDGSGDPHYGVISRRGATNWTRHHHRNAGSRVADLSRRHRRRRDLRGLAHSQCLPRAPVGRGVSRLQSRPRPRRQCRDDRFHLAPSAPPRARRTSWRAR